MTERATLEALLGRVLEGTGPDRELDLAIARDLFDGEPLGHAAGMTDEMLLASNGWGASVVFWPRYTASLDAAITLVPPGAAWVRRTPSTMALVFGGDDFRMAEVHIEPCRALIAACIKAMMEALGD